MIPSNFPYARSANVEAFDFYGSSNIVNAASGDIFSQQLRVGFRQGYLTRFGHGIDDPSAFVGSVFSIRINGIADHYYENIQDQLATFKEPLEIAPILIRPGDRISVFVVNNNAASKLYAARLQGFFDYAVGTK